MRVVRARVEAAEGPSLSRARYTTASLPERPSLRSSSLYIFLSYVDIFRHKNLYLI